MRAAELAEARYAHDVAVALLTDAVASFDRIPREDRDPSERVDLLGRLLRAQVPGRRGHGRPGDPRQRAVEFAESIHRDDLMIAAFTAWTEPTFWQARPYGVVDRPIVDTVEPPARAARSQPHGNSVPVAGGPTPMS